MSLRLYLSPAGFSFSERDLNQAERERLLEERRVQKEQRKQAQAELAKAKAEEAKAAEASQQVALASSKARFAKFGLGGLHRNLAVQWLPTAAFADDAEVR